jgi:hypothetical protein
MGIHHGWAISGVEVLECVKRDSSTATDIVYDITLPPETELGTTVGLYVDRELPYDNFGVDFGYMAVSKENHGNTGYDQWGIASETLADDGDKIDVTLSEENTTIIIFVCFDVFDSSEGLKKYTFNFIISEPSGENDPDPKEVNSLNVTKNSNKTYSEGQTFDRNDITVTAATVSGEQPVQRFKIMPQHVYEGYEKEFKEEYIQKFYADYEITSEEELLGNESLAETFAEYMGAFDGYFEGRLAETLEEHWAGGTGSAYDDGKDYRLVVDDTYVLIFFHNHRARLDGIKVNPTARISGVSILNGQMFDEWFFVNGTPDKRKDSFVAVVLYGEGSGNFSFKASKGAEVYVGDAEDPLEATGETGGDNLYSVGLPTSDSLEGVTTKVKVRTETVGEDGVTPEPFEKVYAFTCYSQKYADMPAEVTEYLCMASQYTNGTFLSGVFGLDPVRTLRGWGLGVSTGVGIDTKCVSLGNFGGYIVYRYDNPIQDKPENPWGVDFIVYGNTVQPDDGFAEPGNVLVSDSEDGPWYTLAGSAHYEDYAKWGYWITYKNDGAVAKWKDKNSSEGTSFSYPLKDRYPHFDWEAKENLENEMTIEGVFLEGGGDKKATTRFPDFGYADTGDSQSDSNVAGNPYIGISDTGRRTTQDGFDLKWAVDEDGQPVDLSGKEIRYVKVQTASFIILPGTNEKSTEVTGVRIAAKSTDKVGQTPLPSQMLVDGTEIDLTKEGTGAYGSVYGAKVNPGAFDVIVAPVSAGSNVYINGVRGAARTFEKMPDHKMLRVIVQEGEKEPAILYVNLEVDNDLTPTPAVKVTFDAGGGTVSPVVKYFTSKTAGEGLAFPTPVWATETMSGNTSQVGYYPFLGWFDSADNKHEGYDKDKITADLTLTAKWGELVFNTVTTVTFDANGGAFSSGATLAKKFSPASADKTFPADPVREGYKFSGWRWAEDGKNYTSFTDTFHNIPALTLTAQWTAIKITAVTFDAKGGLFTSTGKETISRAYSAESTDKSFPAPVREGYKFIGWFDKDGKEHKAYSSALEDVAELALTAKWEAADSGNNSESGGETAPTTIKAEHAVTVEVTPVTKEVNGETVNTATLTAETLSSAIEQAVTKAEEAAPVAGGEAPKPQIQLPPGVEMATVTPDAIKILADDSTRDVEILIPVKGGGAVLDKALAKTLEAALENAGLADDPGLEIAPEIVRVKPDDAPLPEAQKEAASSADVVAVYEVVYKAGDTELELDAPDGEPFTITMAYTLGTDEYASGIRVVHIPENGKTEKKTSGYYKDDEMAWFQTTHLSLYAVTYDPSLVKANETETQEPATQDPTQNQTDQDPADSPGGGCGTGAVGFAALTALAAGAALRRKHREDGR